MGRAVVNLSLGILFSHAIDLAVEAVLAAGIVVVVAAGNEGVDTGRMSPASAAGLITVGMLDETETIVVSSNFGPHVDVFAPGFEIVTMDHADAW